MIRLEDFPKLSDWYHQDANEQQEAIPRAARSLCYYMSKDPPAKPTQYLDVLLTLVKNAASPHKALAELATFLVNLEFSLDEMIVEASERGFSLDSENTIKMVDELAKLTRHPPYCFLAAWLWFNADQLGPCLNHLEYIEPATSASLTLQGQALLELGKVEEAIETLLAATRRDPSEILAFFQLAKAEHVRGKYDNAWSALLSCQKLAPQSDEVATFMALVSLSQTPCDPNKVDISWQAMVGQKSQLAENTDYAKFMLDLAFAGEKEDRVLWIVENLNLASLYQAGGVKELPSLLRKLQNRSWFKASGAFIDSVIQNP